MDKRKTRKETIKMINKERTKVLQKPVTTSSTNILNVEHGYLHCIDDILNLIPTHHTEEDDRVITQIQETLKMLEDEYDIHFPPIWNLLCSFSK